MELIGSIFGMVCAFVSGFVGHVVAHDFCEMVPMISKHLIQNAARALPESVRERHLEEWLADLNDCKGTFAKLKWACGCFLCAHRIRREARRDQLGAITVVVEFDGHGSIELDFVTVLVLHDLMNGANRLYKLPRPFLGRAIFWWIRVSCFRYRKFGSPSSVRLSQFMGMMGTRGKAKVSGKVYFEGTLVEFDELGQAILELAPKSRPASDRIEGE